MKYILCFTASPCHQVAASL